jgi:SnoaL-like domain
MESSDAVRVVRAWQEAANEQDVDRLLALSDPNIELVGPRGSGFGHQLLRDWLGRAGLTLTSLRAFARGSVVVLEQRGTWRSPETGEVTGERALASTFEVSDQGQVARFARYDSLPEALDAAGLDFADNIS